MMPIDTQSAPVACSVVVPVYNEAASLRANMTRLIEWAGSLGMTWELVMVDDGSTDSSRDIIESITVDHEAARSLGYAPNRGRGYALRTGMLSAGGEVVLTTEADLSWDTQCMERLVGIVRRGEADIAVASPYLPGGGLVDVPPAREGLSRVSNRVAGWILGPGTTMATGMTRAYHTSVLSGILSDRDDKSFHLDTLCRARRSDLRVREVPATLSWSRADRIRSGRTTPRALLSSMLTHLGILGEHAIWKRWSR